MPQQSDWKPQTEVAKEDWQPKTERTPVKEHTRKPRTKPGIGATVGGLVGGTLGKAGGPVGAVGGAAAGGAAGEALQQSLENPAFGATQLPMMMSGLGGLNLGQVGQAGVEQGVYEAAGGLLGKGAKVAARPIMRAAILPARAIRMAFSDVAKTALDNGVVMMKPLGKIVGGVKTTSLARAASSAAEDALISHADANGMVTSIDKLAQPMLDSARKFLGRPLTGQEASRVISEVQDVANEAFKTNSMGAVTKAPWSMTGADLKIVKQYTQNSARSLYKAKSAGTVAAGNPDVHAAVASSAKNVLETIPIPGPNGAPIGPQLAEQFSRTQGLIGLNRAVRGRMLGGSGEDVARMAKYGLRGGAVAAGATVGGATPGSPGQRAFHALEGAALGAAATSPLTLSLLAHEQPGPAGPAWSGTQGSWRSGQSIERHGRRGATDGSQGNPWESSTTS